MQIRFGLAELHIVGRAVLASTFLPALALMADHPCRDDMLPLDALGASGILARGVATGAQVDPVATVLAATVELGGLLGIQRPGKAFGFVEVTRRRVEREGEETAEQRQ